jgi:hypothetical protein
MDLTQSFLQAIQQGDLTVVEHLLDQEPALVDGRTPSDLAWERGHLEVVEILKSAN